MKYSFKISDIDDILSRESKYIKDLKTEFGHTEDFSRNIRRIVSIAKKRKLDYECLEPFLNSVDTGIIYVVIGQKSFELLFSMFPLLISSSIDKYDLKSTIRNLYKKAVESDKDLSLLFELTVIKAFISFFREEHKGKKHEKEFNNAINTLRDTLIEIRNEICSYIAFNRDFHRHILDKALITPNLEFSDSWGLLKQKIVSYYFPFELFTDLVGFFNTLASLDREMEIIKYFEEKTIWSIDDISSPPYPYYLPFLRDEVKGIILKTISKKSKQTREYLIKEENDLNSQINNIKKDINDELKEFDTAFIQEITSSLQYPANVSLVSKINSYIIDFNRKTMGNILMANKLLERFNMLKKKMMKNEQMRNITYEQLINLFKKQGYIENSDIFLSMEAFSDYMKHFEDLFDKNKKYVLKISKTSFNNLKNAYKQNSSRETEEQLLLMKNIINAKTFSTKFNYDFIRDNYADIMSSIENDLIVFLLLENIRVFNVEYSKSRVKEKKEYFFINNYLMPHKKLFYFDGKTPCQKERMSIREGNLIEVGQIIKKHYLKVVSSLVYDIRGSSFMSQKLNNAEQQVYIMRKYQGILNNVLKSHDGFPIKETGDGGIALFFNKSKELYRNLFKETMSSRNVHIRHSIATGSNLAIKESEIASSKALDCSIKLIENTENFIKDNYINYRDWFFDVHEKKLIHEGIEYALLPPEFKSLFRIGVGIASGIINKDISLNVNAFGDIDVYGADINEAKTFSEGRDPAQSVIIIDHITLFNLILNKEFFIDDINIERDDYFSNFLTMMQNEPTLTLKHVGNFFINPVGTYVKSKREKSKRMLFDFIPTDLEIDENGILYSDNEPIKLLYQITVK